MKKIFAVALLAVGFAFISQFAYSPTVSAGEFARVKDFYAYTDKGIDYYINYIEWRDEMYGNGIKVDLACAQNGKKISDEVHCLGGDSFAGDKKSYYVHQAFLGGGCNEKNLRSVGVCDFCRNF